MREVPLVQFEYRVGTKKAMQLPTTYLSIMDRLFGRCTVENKTWSIVMMQSTSDNMRKDPFSKVECDEKENNNTIQKNESYFWFQSLLFIFLRTFFPFPSVS
jgi:hypothetical protein